MSKITLVAVIRNGAPYLLDWLTHHLAVGADEFVFCVHGSSDGTAKLTRRLDAMGYGAHLKITVADNDPDASALTQIAELDEIKQADWIGMLHIDQYLNIHTGYGRLNDVLGVADSSVDTVELTSLSFGADPAPNENAQRITERCQLREEADAPSGRPVRIARRLDALKTPKNLWQISPGLAQINQYTCRSIEHLAMCLSTPLYQTEDQILKAWLAQNKSEMRDETIRRYDQWYERYARFLRADRRLRMVEKSGQDWHRSRAEAAWKSEHLKELLARARV